MGTDPLVSVCVPAYRAAPFLRRTIQSVLEQTFKDFEIIVVDDASPDGTLDSIDDLDDPRIQRYSNPTNLGGGANWNRAVGLARGRLIKVLCSDDLLYPNCLKQQARLLEDPNWRSVGLVSCWRDIIDIEGRRILSRKSGQKRGFIPRDEARKWIVRSGTNPVGEPAAVMFRRELLNKAGPFNGANPFVLDIDMWIRMLLQADIYILPEIQCAFRVSSQSWSVRLAKKQAKSYLEWVRGLTMTPEFRLKRTDLRVGIIRSRLLGIGRGLFYLKHAK